MWRSPHDARCPLDGWMDGIHSGTHIHTNTHLAKVFARSSRLCKIDRSTAPTTTTWLLIVILLFGARKFATNDRPNERLWRWPGIQEQSTVVSSQPQRSAYSSCRTDDDVGVDMEDLNHLARINFTLPILDNYCRAHSLFRCWYSTNKLLPNDHRQLLHTVIIVLPLTAHVSWSIPLSPPLQLILLRTSGHEWPARIYPYFHCKDIRTNKLAPANRTALRMIN